MKKSKIADFRFYKKGTAWYVIFQDDLMMVAGADLVLEDLSKRWNEVFLSVSDDRFEGSDELKLIRESDFSGADYSLREKISGYAK
jgi:hypothetical protein